MYFFLNALIGIPFSWGSSGPGWCRRIAIERAYLAAAGLCAAEPAEAHVSNLRRFARRTPASPGSQLARVAHADRGRDRGLASWLTDACY